MRRALPYWSAVSCSFPSQIARRLCRSPVNHSFERAFRLLTLVFARLAGQMHPVLLGKCKWAIGKPLWRARINTAQNVCSLRMEEGGTRLCCHGCGGKCRTGREDAAQRQ